MRITKADLRTFEMIKKLLDQERKPKTISELSTIAEISESKLEKGFKQLYNTTIYHYHLTQRMAYAKLRITEGARIKEMAHELGYADRTAFTKAFKRIYDVPPDDYK